MLENNTIKYSNEDIERIFAERVRCCYRKAVAKAGTVCEWTFCYPNGAATAQVDCAFPIDPANADEEIGRSVVNEKIKDQLWQICGQYSLITGEKL